jgi:hypothetical protein
VTVTLTTLSSRDVTVDVDPSPLLEAGPGGITVTLGLQDGPLALTFTATEVRDFMTELVAVITFAE